MTDLIVSEVFGPTTQGEGPSQGRPVMFLRLGLCNLDCQWCDTPYTWDWTGKNGPPQDRQALYRLAPQTAIDAVSRTGRVVITGGEPLLQRRALVTFGDLALAARLAVEVETNGTLVPPAELVGWQWNVSPKLANSGITEGRRLTDALAVFAEWAGRSAAVCFKFVVTSIDDVAEIEKLAATYRLPDHAIWLMPEGRSADAILARQGWVTEQAAEHGWNASTRLHVLAWGDERGR